jgi:hypothetical protein
MVASYGTFIPKLRWEAAMRFATAMKSILAVILGLLTFWATSSIVAQTKSARMKRASQHETDSPSGKVVAPPPMVSTVAKTRQVNGNEPVVNEPDPREVLDAFARSGTLSEARLIQMDVTTVGRRVDVSESVHILEKSPNASYVWALRVYRGADKQPGQVATKLADRLLSERYYVNQSFHVPADLMQMKPTFKETFELGPGVYHVQVSLERIRPNVDLRQINDENIRQFKGGVSGIKRIVITD